MHVQLRLWDGLDESGYSARERRQGDVTPAFVALAMSQPTPGCQLHRVLHATLLQRCDMCNERDQRQRRRSRSARTCVPGRHVHGFGTLRAKTAGGGLSLHGQRRQDTTDGTRALLFWRAREPVWGVAPHGLTNETLHTVRYER